MKKSIFYGALLSLIASLLISCTPITKTEPASLTKPSTPILDKPTRVSTSCPQKRPEMCTRQYDPVCGYWLGGVPCKPGAACPAIAVIQKKTYSNSCSACSDKKIKGYTKGRCT